MPKTTQTDWSPLSAEHHSNWQPIEGLEGVAEELTLAIDEETSDYASRPPKANCTAPSTPPKAA